MSELIGSVNIAKLTAPFPPEAIKQRDGGGRRKLSYVEGHTVIHRLNDACGYVWDFRVLREWQEGNVLCALCELSLPGLGSRQHVGVQTITPNGGEDLRKGAITDALKKCATLYGVALELYGNDYAADAEQAAQAGQQRQHAPQDRRQQAEEAIRHARDLFDSVAAESGLTFKTGPDRGKWANSCLGRAANVRTPFTLKDWEMAAQRLPETIAAYKAAKGSKAGNADGTPAAPGAMFEGEVQTAAANNPAGRI